MLLSKKTIRTLGFVFSTLALILAIIAIVLAGIDYIYAGPHFRPNSFHAIPQIQVASIIFAFLAIGMSYGAFWKPNINFTVITSVVVMLSLLWNISSGVYSIVGGRYGWWNSFAGCQIKFKGLMGNFHNTDTYLKIVDQYLCSRICPCFISNNAAYEGNTTTSSYYNLWTKTANPSAAVSFQNCSEQVQTAALEQARQIDANFDPHQTFNDRRFWNYMANVEQNFACSGWCDVLYFNPDFRKQVLMSKYLFTDVNRGPPHHFGCINNFMDWLSGMLQGFGSVTLVLVGTQMALFALLLCQCYAREKDHEKQIPHHHDDNRQ